jgi:hypothetical protein
LNEHAFDRSGNFIATGAVVRSLIQRAISAMPIGLSSAAAYKAGLARIIVV